jgi:hypothetical protein
MLLEKNKNLMKEEWRVIQNTNGKYSVSNLGNVKRNEHYTTAIPSSQHPNGMVMHYADHILQPYINAEGYAIVKLTVARGDSRTIKVHNLVAREFIPNPNNFTQINHKNEVRDDNRVENLEWCTQQYNSNYGTRNQKISKTSGIKVAQYTQDGKLIKVWDSILQASKSFGVKTTSNISRVCKGVPGRKTYRGFVWKYVDSKVIGDSDLKTQMLKNKAMLLDLIINTFSREEKLELYNCLEVDLNKWN